MPPVASILVPVYNLQSYETIIQENFLKSIELYLENNIEIILNDNRSTDDTLRILYDQFGLKNKKFRELHLPENLIIYENKRNLGVAPNLNISQELASGPYYCMGSIRSQYSIEGLLAMVNLLDENLNLGFAWGDTQYTGKSNYLVKCVQMDNLRLLDNFSILQGYLYRQEAYYAGLRYTLGCYRENTFCYPCDWDYLLQLINYLGYKGGYVNQLTLTYYYSGVGQQTTIYQKYEKEIKNILKTFWVGEIN